MQPKRIALLAKDAAEDIKAEETVILDVSKYTSVAHYFVITQGNSDRQVKAIANNVGTALKEKGVQVWNQEGLDSGTWALIDFGGVIVHVFHKDTRDFYALERLWGDAKRL